MRASSRQATTKRSMTLARAAAATLERPFGVDTITDGHWRVNGRPYPARRLAETAASGSVTQPQRPAPECSSDSTVATPLISRILWMLTVVNLSAVKAQSVWKTRHRKSGNPWSTPNRQPSGVACYASSAFGPADKAAMARTSRAAAELGRRRWSSAPMTTCYPCLRRPLCWVGRVAQTKSNCRAPPLLRRLAGSRYGGHQRRVHAYLFRAGKYHAAGPRHPRPSAYITTSIGLMGAAFARCLGEAKLPATVIARRWPVEQFPGGATAPDGHGLSRRAGVRPRRVPVGFCPLRPPAPGGRGSGR
jgi:hypothetical protein